MAFNLNEFKADVSKRGLLRPHTYECRLDLPILDGDASSPQNKRDLTIRTDTVAVPGVGFNTVTNYRPFGYGRTYDIPYSYNPQEITCGHIMDQNADTYKLFTDWSHKIVEYQAKRAEPVGNSPGKKHYSAYYFDNYVGTMEIVVYDNEGNVVKTIQIFQVYPTTVDQMQLSWSENDSIVRLNVTYKYTEYEVKNF